jgi:hypothetical protein
LLSVGRIPHNRNDLGQLLKIVYQLKNPFNVIELRERAEYMVHLEELQEYEKKFGKKKEAENENE